MTEKKIISIYITNRFGSLAKVTTLFSRRGCNIQLLTVCATQIPEYSRITITVEDHPDKIAQIFSQLHKLEDVKDVTELPNEQYLERTVALLKMKKGVLVDAKDWCREDRYVKTHTLDDGTVAIEAMGSSSSIDELIEKMNALGVEKISRPGCAALYLLEKEEYNHIS